MERTRNNLQTAAVLVYVAVVLGADTLAAYDVRWGFRWSTLSWNVRGVDLFKLVFWFVLPFLWSLRGMDWGWFGIARWKRVDGLILLGMLALGTLAILVIPLFPGLRATYPGMGHAPSAAKWAFAAHNVTWTLSWLLGWEFLHRYALLRPVSARWPRWGWLLAPLSEGLYHLQKAPVEALGMVVFSLLATQWTLRRRNALLPFAAHLYIELALTAYLLIA